MGRLESAFHGIRHDIDRLSNFYVEQGSRVDKIRNLCESMQENHSQQFSDIKDSLEEIWHNLGPLPPPQPYPFQFFTYAPGELRPHPPYRQPL